MNVGCPTLTIESRMEKFPNLGSFFTKISEPWKFFHKNFRTLEVFERYFPNLGKMLVIRQASFKFQVSNF